MASEQTNTNEAIVQAVAKATGAVIQVIAVARAERTPNVGPRLVEYDKTTNIQLGSRRQVQWTQKLQTTGKQYLEII